MPKKKWEPIPQDYKFVEMFGGTLSLDQIAEYYGITKRQVHNRFKDHPEWRAVYDESRVAKFVERAADVDEIEQELVRKAKGGNLKAIFFYLRTKGDFQEKRVHEHSGPGGGPIEHQFETPEEARRDVLGSLARIAERLAETGGARGVGGGGQPGALDDPEVRMDLLGPPGSVPSTDEEVVLVADVIWTGSGEDEDGVGVDPPGSDGGGRAEEDGVDREDAG